MFKFGTIIKNKKMKKVLSLVVMMVLTSMIHAQKADDIIGIWLTEGGKSKVEVTRKEGKYYGKIIWLKTPNREDGTPKLDRENENEKLRSRPIIGMQLITDFVWDDDEYEDGEIYDPENGKLYSCEITYETKDILNVRGYIGFSLLGRTTVWTRVK